MQIKILSKRVLLIVAFLGFVFTVAFFLNFIPKKLIQGNLNLFVENVAILFNQEQVPVHLKISNIEADIPVENVALFLNQEQESVGLPVRLKIPSIEVDAPVEHAGLTPDGAMDVSEGFYVVTWFDIGPRSGENGSSVMAGHYAGKNRTPAVFDDLHKLGIGDNVFVEDENGVIITFVVREIRIYDKDEIVPEVFSSSDGKAHLNLIACTGVWNQTKKTYSERLVVFTDKE